MIEGALVFLEVEALPSRRSPQPLWLWTSAVGLGPGEVDRLWQAYLRRFDIEHTFRFLKQQLGWNAPRLRDPAAADRWGWIVIAAYTRLRLARCVVGDVRLPWQRPAEPGRLSPSRVRRGFRRIRALLPVPAGVPRGSRPGPGRPRGSRNKRPAPRHGVPKKNKTGTMSCAGDKQAS
ncbi:transposase [Nocardiopsis mangrovi]|uniref:Transposase n=1 Tax=Nocardiopsis mangrovi TaxID=1179818 RepID=A0ABV9DU28_9ACTN